MSRSLYIWIALGLVVGSSAIHSTDVQEYCEWETFNATCAEDEVVVIEAAKYGRMTLGRCVTKNYGHIGCGTDVTADFDRRCSGKRQCLVPIISLHDKRSCPKDFKSYLEASFTCVKVTLPPGGATSCPKQGHVAVKAEHGVLASAVAPPGPCPWTVTVMPYQRINVTLVDFAVPASTDYWYSTSMVSSGGTRCVQYASIWESPVTGNTTICGGQRRETTAFVSHGNKIKIYMTPSQQNSFMLKFQAFGCPPLQVPSNAWVKSNGEHAVIQCNATDEAWYLTCRGTEWLGEVANCTSAVVPITEPEEQWSIGVLGNVSQFPFGILIVVALGVAIGVAIGVVMLVAVLAYMRRRRRRKIRSRSQYMLKQLPNNCPECADEDTKASTETTLLGSRTDMLKDGSLGSATLSRSYMGVNWQKRRSLTSPGRASRSSPSTPTSPPPHQGHPDGMVLLTELPSSPTRRLPPDACATLPKGFSTFRPVSSQGEPSSPRNAYIISDGGGENATPYYFKLDPANPGLQEHTHNPDVVSGHCIVCLANARNNTLRQS